jgi:hypothetical protein
MVLPSAAMTERRLVQESMKVSFLKLYWSIRIGRLCRVLKFQNLLEGIDIEEGYGIFRSFKRGAITRAQEAGVGEADVNRVDQWRRIEMAQGRQVGGSTREHYSELVQMLDARLRFSRAL